MSEPRWHVIGAGAMGCLFAAALHRSGCHTTLVLRGAAPGGSVPVLVEGAGTGGKLHLPATAAGEVSAITHLLVTTKAYDVHSAVASIAHRLDPGSTVVLLVNGMGLARQLRGDWPHLDLYCGTTTEGAYRIAPRHVRHAGRGQTRIGQPGRRDPAPWFRQWSRAVDACQWHTNIEQALWSKLAVNCAINPLTALHGCHNGELARRPELAMEVERLCHEITLVCRAAGYPQIATALPQTVGEVIAATAGNRSSMLQDVQAGRRTEIDYITGYLLKVAGEHGIATPRNAALLEGIHNLER